ncbi:MAG: putative bifunctional diguanylate cyclase/phosphodiesterase [Jatrophihabitans sp.]|uniref:putative bifunctional diguanylate cyclase/phosphodiesterase n=1 Tax=Jatrophihabitans sp. TaxID=1932789 RepID=UPI003F7E87C1
MLDESRDAVRPDLVGIPPVHRSVLDSEFAVLLHNIADPELAEDVARGLVDALRDAASLDGLHLAVAGSVGIACFPDRSTSTDELMRRSDVALVHARHMQAALRSYIFALDEQDAGSTALGTELRDAIGDGQFQFVFQPQIDLSTQRLVGAEALARWNHPTRGLLGPVEFMTVIERSGFVREFTLHALDRACAAAAEWWRLGLHVPVSVNLSARNLLDLKLPADVAATLVRHELPPERLILEITESSAVSDARTVEMVLAKLRDVGVQLSVDDFGTGYSSMAFLQRVSVDEIKIDKSFVIPMTRSASDQAIVRATIELAHGLGVRVVAEGVETGQHAEQLKRLHCDVAQGWHYGKPGTVDQLRTAETTYCRPALARRRRAAAS